MAETSIFDAGQLHLEDYAAPLTSLFPARFPSAVGLGYAGSR